MRQRWGISTGWELAKNLWGFLSKRLGPTLYENRIPLAHGCEGNGFELWRRLFVDHEGGDRVIQLDGRTGLQNFPICTMSNIGLKLDSWQNQMMRFGGDIGPDTRVTMLLKILPQELRNDVIKRGELYSVDLIIGYIRRQLVWGKSEALLKDRGGAGGIYALNGEKHNGSDDPPPPHPEGPLTAENVYEMIAAMTGGKGTRPPPKNRDKGGDRSTSPRIRIPRFPEGHCFHCNGTGHNRTPDKEGKNGCPAFAKLLKDNGGTLPKGYKGAFELHKEKHLAAAKNKRVNALLDADDTEDESDDDFPKACGAVWNISTCPVCSIDPFAPADVITHNSFDAFTEYPLPCADVPLPCKKKETSENGHAVKSVTFDSTPDLNGWSVKVSAKKNCRKGWRLDTDEDVQKFGSMICAARKPDEKTMRRIQEDLELDELAENIDSSKSLKSNKKMAHKVWAMVDSGSFVTIADCARTFPGHDITKSKASRAGVKYSNASGGEIANEGEVVITHRLDDGTEIDIPFQHGKVQLPIISVKDFVQKGSVVKFKRLGGSIRLPNGRTMRFVEKHGVYFLRLCVVSGKPPEAGFIWPEP